MKTIKIIDLLVNIANEKGVPKKIKWEDTIFVYSNYDKDYLKLPYSVDEYQGLFCMKDSILTQYLNDEVEIIEDIPISKLYVNNELQYDLTPKEDNKIEHIGKIYDITNFKNDYHEVAKLLNDIANKQYEIIDYINKEKQ